MHLRSAIIDTDIYTKTMEKKRPKRFSNSTNRNTLRKNISCNKATITVI